MLHFQVITLFPQLFVPFREHGLISRGIDDGLLNLSTIYLRDYAINTQGQVDDTPYGGGSGMVLRPEPAAAAIQAAKKITPQAKVILLSPRGEVFTQKTAQKLFEESSGENGGLILLSPRYEGIDERIASKFVDYQISIGDYVVMGGEVPAMLLIESIARLVPGVLGNSQSLESESFQDGLLEYPQYTKPNEFEGEHVPEILLSGNHQKISDWRKARAIADTIERRADLLNVQPQITCDLSVALVHHPVTDKQGKTITSSITHLDLHDISRSAKTFGVDRFYAAHPVRAMRKLAQKIFDHWDTGYGSIYNPNRSEALQTLAIVTDLDDVFIDIEKRCGVFPKVITTSAKPSSKQISYEKMRAHLRTSTEPHLLLLGTGWGLGSEIMDGADYHLEPVHGAGDYNHLSVRAAAAIIFERLLSNKSNDC